LIERVNPDLVVTDHAPTALLAARSLGRTRARIGTGFSCPPAIDPEPPLMPWAPPGKARRAESARLILTNTNAALTQLGAANIGSLAQLHESDQDFVTTYPELDHYRSRPEAAWGVVLGAEQGGAPGWPPETGPRAFVYLKGHQAQTVPILRALRRKRLVAVAFCPGLAAGHRAAFASERLRFADRPLDIESAASSCDLVVCGAGHGTVCAALLAGKPMLLAPEVGEQGITARYVEDLGAGIALEPDHTAGIAAMLTRLIDEPQLREAARAFAQRHGGASQAQIVARIAERCVELCGAGGGR
jgi:hypothetical protein